MGGIDAAARRTADSLPTVEIRMGQEVRNIGIPPRPAMLDRIAAEMARDEPDYRKLAEIVGSDVGLAASVIKVANAPYFGFTKRVRTVSDALMVLGLKTIARTVAGLELQKTFPHVPSLERFWDSSACTARVAGWLAQQLPRQRSVKADDAYTFGLFRDCGIPVLMIPFPEYQATLKAANVEEQRSFTEVEDQSLCINHAVVGAELSEDWMLPEEIHAAIRYHHDLAALQGGVDLPPSSRILIAVAQVAEHLIQRHTGLNQSKEWEKLGAASLSVLDAGEEDLERWVAACGPVVAGD